MVLQLQIIELTSPGTLQRTNLKFSNTFYNTYLEFYMVTVSSPWVIYNSNNLMFSRYISKYKPKFLKLEY